MNGVENPPNVSSFGPPPPPPPPAYRPYRPSAFRRLLSWMGCLLFIGSLVMNVYLLILVGVRGLQIDRMDTTVLKEGGAEQVVAVYDVCDVIAEKASEDFDRFCRAVQNDEKVKAVVLYVDSPGGTVSASERIRHQVLQLKERGKKVVVAMGGVAASGGYYISAPADTIFAEPGTITGSIGVIGVVPNFKGTLDKIGMRMVVLKSQHAEGWKDQLSPYRDHDEREKTYLVELLNQMQDRFEQVVREGRGGKLVTKQESYTTTVGQGEEAHSVTKQETAPFNGKIYLADAAKSFGLVDEIGFLDDACQRAAKLAGLDQPRVLRYQPHRSFFETMFESKASGLEISAEALDRLQSPRVMMLWKPEL